MLTYNIHVTRRMAWAAIGFDAQQSESLGLAAIAAMKTRIAKGFNVDDQPATPLAANYQRLKVRKGLSPLPNLRFSGELLDQALQVTSSEPGKVVVGIVGQKNIQKAIVNQTRRNQLGISREDASAVNALALSIFAENVRRVLTRAA